MVSNCAHQIPTRVPLYGEATKNTIRAHYAQLSQAYGYYSVMGSGAEESMQLNEYTELCNDIDIPDKTSKYCKLKDIDGIFITAAFKDAEEGKRLGLDKKSLGRHEFIEAFIRMSEAKFGHGQRGDEAPDLPSAVELCCREKLIPGLPPDSVFDINEFRRKQLYDAEVDETIKAHKPLILGLFASYRSRRRTRGLCADGWMEMLTECRLLTDHIGPIGLNGRECKLLFLWSRMLKVDMHTVPKGWTQGAITLVEFIEAIARTADIISLPTPEDVKDAGYESMMVRAGRRGGACCGAPTGRFTLIGVTCSRREGRGSRGRGGRRFGSR